MKTKLTQILQTGLLIAAVALLGAACSTTSSSKAKPLKAANVGDVDLKKYQVATVAPFGVPPDGKVDASVGAKFAEDVAVRIQKDFGPLFNQVRKESPLCREDEVIVSGTIRTYRPGSRFARGMLIGLGSASFKGDLILKNGKDQRVLLTAPFDKLWAWGGILGMSKGIEDMTAEAAAAVARTVAHAKGWQPDTAAAPAKPVEGAATPK